MTQKELWNNTRLFVIDIDGTFQNGQTLVKDAREFLTLLEENHKDYLFFTNNSSRMPETYREEFRQQGCIVPKDAVVSTADVAVYYLKRYYDGQKVYVVGTEKFCTYLKEKGICVTDNNPTVVLIGFDTTFTYEKMKKASDYIRTGAKFLATHLDINCPVENGLIPDCGSICASVMTSTGRRPISLGKPSKLSVEMLLHRTGYAAEQLTFIGDRIATDISAGFYNGANTCLVLGGASTKEEAAGSEVKPDFIFNSLSHLYETLKKNLLVCPYKIN